MKKLIAAGFIVIVLVSAGLIAAALQRQDQPISKTGDLPKQPRDDVRLTPTDTIVNLKEGMVANNQVVDQVVGELKNRDVKDLRAQSDLPDSVKVERWMYNVKEVKTENGVTVVTTDIIPVGLYNGVSVIAFQPAFEEVSELEDGKLISKNLKKMPFGVIQ